MVINNTFTQLILQFLYESARTRFIELYRDSAGICYDKEELIK